MSLNWGQKRRSLRSEDEDGGLRAERRLVFRHHSFSCKHRAGHIMSGAAERDPLLPHVHLFKAQGHAQHEHAVHVAAGLVVCLTAWFSLVCVVKRL